MGHVGGSCCERAADGLRQMNGERSRANDGYQSRRRTTNRDNRRRTDERMTDGGNLTVTIFSKCKIILERL